VLIQNPVLLYFTISIDPRPDALPVTGDPSDVEGRSVDRVSLMVEVTVLIAMDEPQEHNENRQLSSIKSVDTRC
jgi:hypothetical protein